MIGCEDRLRNDLYCVGWGTKLYSIQSNDKHNRQYDCTITMESVIHPTEHLDHDNILEPQTAKTKFLLTSTFLKCHI